MGTDYQIVNLTTKGYLMPKLKIHGVSPSCLPVLYSPPTLIALFCYFQFLVSIISPVFVLEVTSPFSAYIEGLPLIRHGITYFSILAATLQLSSSTL
jgi:hypothetical protein